MSPVSFSLSIIQFHFCRLLVDMFDLLKFDVVAKDDLLVET